MLKLITQHKNSLYKTKLSYSSDDDVMQFEIISLSYRLSLMPIVEILIYVPFNRTFITLCFISGQGNETHFNKTHGFDVYAVHYRDEVWYIVGYADRRSPIHADHSLLLSQEIYRRHVTSK